MAPPQPPRWEHVVEVETAIERGVALVKKGGSQVDFDDWFVNQCRRNWKICIVTREEDERLKKNRIKGPKRYSEIGWPFDEDHKLRGAIILRDYSDAKVNRLINSIKRC